MDAPPIQRPKPAPSPFTVAKDGQWVKFDEKIFYVTIYHNGKRVALDRPGNEQKALIAACAKAMFAELGDALQKRDATVEFSFKGKSECSLKALGTEKILNQDDAYKISALLSSVFEIDIQPKNPLCAAFKRERGEFTCYANAFLHTIFTLLNKPLEKRSLKSDADPIARAHTAVFNSFCAIQKQYLDPARPTIEATDVKAFLSALQEFKELIERGGRVTASQLDWRDCSIQHDPVELFDFFATYILGGEFLRSISEPLISLKSNGFEDDGAPFITLSIAGNPQEPLSVKSLFESKVVRGNRSGKTAFAALDPQAIPRLLPISLYKANLDRSKIGAPIHVEEQLELELGDKSRAIYELRTAMCHEGQRTDLGHFTSVKLLPTSSGSTWAHCNDERIKERFYHELFGASGIVTKQAAFLLYLLVKVEPPPQQQPLDQPNNS